jgi:predicted transcriptional regulator of viral defense system
LTLGLSDEDQVYNFIASACGGVTSDEIHKNFTTPVRVPLMSLTRSGRVYRFNGRYYTISTLESGAKLSLSEKVLQMISDVGVELTSDKVSRALKANQHSCATTLAQLHRNGRIRRVSHGVYAAFDPK